jgi:hypothetical protein
MKRNSLRRDSRGARLESLPSKATYMPLLLLSGHPSLLIRRSAFERAGLSRGAFDHRLNLTSDEFRVEGELICIGPIHEEEALQSVIGELETAGLIYYDDFFDLSGNWPDWLLLYGMMSRNAAPNDVA